MLPAIGRIGMAECLLFGCEAIPGGGSVTNFDNSIASYVALSYIRVGVEDRVQQVGGKISAEIAAKPCGYDREENCCVGCGSVCAQ